MAGWTGWTLQHGTNAELAVSIDKDWIAAPLIDSVDTGDKGLALERIGRRCG